MNFLDNAEIREWCKSHAVGVDGGVRPVIASEGFQTRRFQIPPSASRHLWFSRVIESVLQPWQRCLVWVTAWGIWRSSENWHLYYRFRQSYGDQRLIEEAPGHLLLDYEAPELISLVQLGLSAGWDISLLTREDYARVAISHDEWIAVACKDVTVLERLAQTLAGSGVLALS